MATTYEKIATTTLGSSASSITVSSIPSTFTDIRLVLVGKGNGGEIYPEGYLNSDTSGNYSSTTIYSSGTSAASGRNVSSTRFIASGARYPDDTYYTMLTIDIFSYAGSTYKTLLTTSSTDKNTTGGIGRIISLWRSTSAITSITITDGGAGFGWAVGTTATIYGILKA